MLFYLILLLIPLFILWVRHRFCYWKARGVPYVEPTFPHGNLPDLGKRHVGLQIRDVYCRLKGSGKQFGGMFFSFKPTAVALDLDFLKDVLVKDFEYFHDRGLYFNDKVEPMNSHLITLEGERWRNLRAKLTPNLTAAKVKMMFPLMTAVGDELVKYISAEVLKGGPVEMKETFARFTTDVIGSYAFGLECNSLKDPDAKFRAMGRKAMAMSVSRFFRRTFGFSYRRLARLLRVRTIDTDVADFFMNVVRDTIDYRQKHNIRRNDVMDLLMQLKVDESSNEDQSGKLTFNEIAAQAFVYLLAGFETSSTTISYCVYELAQNQHLQEKARKNIEEVLAQHGSMTYEAINDMKFVEKCINEALRKHPPPVHILREVTKDYHVPQMNVTLEKGIKIMIPIYAIHHDPQYYPDPEQFDPDRFDPEVVAKRHSMAFIPFGAGPRICIGLRYGMMQATVGLVYFLKHFRFTLSSKTITPMRIHPTNIVSGMYGGLWLDVEKL